jgi:hypothetical protein
MFNLKNLGSMSKIVLIVCGQKNEKDQADYEKKLKKIVLTERSNGICLKFLYFSKSGPNTQEINNLKSVLKNRPSGRIFFDNCSSEIIHCFYKTISLNKKGFVGLLHKDTYGRISSEIAKEFSAIDSYFEIVPDAVGVETI